MDVIFVLKDGPLDGDRIGLPRDKYEQAVEDPEGGCLKMNHQIGDVWVQTTYMLDLANGVAHYQGCEFLVDHVAETGRALH